jgi:hypothetical protein
MAGLATCSKRRYQSIRQGWRLKGRGFRVQGSAKEGSGFSLRGVRVQGSVLRVQGSGFRKY